MANSFVETHCKSLMLLSACVLSVGSHYGNYLVGPLKESLSEQLHTTSVDFASMLSAMSLVNTVVPLLGFLVPRYGPARMGLIATATIIAGMSLVWLSDMNSSLSGMVCV